MSFTDVRIVAIALILAVTYGTFLFFNAQAEQTDYSSKIENSTQYETPDSGNFFTQLESIGQMQDDHPEIFFINSMVFGVVAFLLVFVGLRFIRGTG